MYIAPDVQLEFFDAGHILGSAFAYFTITGQRRNPISGRTENSGMGSGRRFWHRLFGIDRGARKKDGGRAMSAWWYSVEYTISYYFDLSAYADMAIGIGLMFNVAIPETSTRRTRRGTFRTTGSGGT